MTGSQMRLRNGTTLTPIAEDSDMTYGYTIYIYKKDGRCKDGERLVEKRNYPGYSGHAAMEQKRYLQLHEFKPEDGYSLGFGIMTI